MFIWVNDINYNKEFFIAHTHRKVEKSYWSTQVNKTFQSFYEYEQWKNISTLQDFGVFQNLSKVLCATKPIHIIYFSNPKICVLHT